MKKKKPYKTVALKKRHFATLRLIGNNFHTLRQNRKESLKTVANAIGISRGHLSNIEKGLAPRFKLTVLAGLCDYFKVKMSEVAARHFKPNSE